MSQSLLPHNPEEILSIIDYENNVVGSASRKEIHKKGFLHREVYIYLINNKLKSILLQKRTDDGTWDHSVAGHIPAGQSYEAAAVREVEEELGLKIKKADLQHVSTEEFCSKKPEKINHRIVKLFVVQTSRNIEDFAPDPGEVEQVKYFNKQELMSLINNTKKIVGTSTKEIIKKYFIETL